MVSYHGPAAVRDGRNEIDIYAGSDREGVRISAFYDSSSPELVEATRAVRQGSRIVILLSNLNDARRFNGLLADLVEADEILPLD